MKKMWALIVDYGTHKEIESVSKVKETEMILSQNITSVGSEVKPVWVCDRDPHENVKKLISDYPKFDYTKISLARAVEKDIENTEGG